MVPVPPLLRTNIMVRFRTELHVFELGLWSVEYIIVIKFWLMFAPYHRRQNVHERLDRLCLSFIALSNQQTSLILILLKMYGMTFSGVLLLNNIFQQTSGLSCVQLNCVLQTTFKLQTSNFHACFKQIMLFAACHDECKTSLHCDHYFPNNIPISIAYGLQPTYFIYLLRSYNNMFLFNEQSVSTSFVFTIQRNPIS